jgi:hypothetical protein
MRKQTLSKLAVALLIGTSITILTVKFQHQLKAGSIPDLMCELALLPGKLFASIFHDHGTASAEFLWRTWVFTAALLSGIAYMALRPKKRLGAAL